MKNNVLEMIGNTNLVKLNNVTDKDIYVKVEKENPAGSVKDRPAYYMLKDAIDSGILKEGMKIVEPTSGNTGIALAMIGNMLGYSVTIVMPESMSAERRALMKSFGAELILTEASEGMQGSVNKAKELAETGNYYMPDQFSNPSNARAHEETTAVELLSSGIDIKGFIAGVGTGGTVSGVGRVLKKKDSNIQIWALEPEESPLLSEGKAGTHKIQGIGANFVPKLLDKSVLDKVIAVSSEEALEMSRRLAKEEGLMVGISSGANVVGAIKMSEIIDGPIVTVLPDTSERYLSTPLFE